MLMLLDFIKMPQGYNKQLMLEMQTTMEMLNSPPQKKKKKKKTNSSLVASAMAQVRAPQNVEATENSTHNPIASHTSSEEPPTDDSRFELPKPPEAFPTDDSRFELPKPPEAFPADDSRFELPKPPEAFPADDSRFELPKPPEAIFTFQAVNEESPIVYEPDLDLSPIQFKPSVQLAAIDRPVSVLGERMTDLLNLVENNYLFRGSGNFKFKNCVPLPNRQLKQIYTNFQAVKPRLQAAVSENRIKDLATDDGFSFDDNVYWPLPIDEISSQNISGISFVLDHSQNPSSVKLYKKLTRKSEGYLIDLKEGVLRVLNCHSIPKESSSAYEDMMRQQNFFKEEEIGMEYKFDDSREKTVEKCDMLDHHITYKYDKVSGEKSIEQIYDDGSAQSISFDKDGKCIQHKITVGFQAKTGEYYTLEYDKLCESFSLKNFDHTLLQKVPSSYLKYREQILSGNYNANIDSQTRDFILNAKPSEDEALIDELLPTIKEKLHAINTKEGCWNKEEASKKMEMWSKSITEMKQYPVEVRELPPAYHLPQIPIPEIPNIHDELEQTSQSFITEKMEEDIHQTLLLAADWKPKEVILASLKNLRTLCQSNPSNLISDCPDITVKQNPLNGKLIIKHKSIPENYLLVDSFRKMILIVNFISGTTMYCYQDQD